MQLHQSRIRYISIGKWDGPITRTIGISSDCQTLEVTQMKSMARLHTRVTLDPLPVLPRASGNIYSGHLHVLQSLIYSCMVHAVVSAAPMRLKC
jgi:hypothetical protein